MVSRASFLLLAASCLRLATATKATLAAGDNDNVQTSTAEPFAIPNAYIVELDDDQDTASFLQQSHAAGLGNVTQRLSLSSPLFKGLSFSVSPSSSSQVQSSFSHHEETHQRIKALPAVKQIWPVVKIPSPKAERVWTAQGSAMPVSKRAEADAFSPHVMTQVDKLHAAGYNGTGIRIGIIDTGVDYTHPALGDGCFGKADCVVAYGADLVGDAYTGDNAPSPDADPLDQCNGHGTHVSGIIAAQSNPFGFTGAAPGAKLGAYRVFGCDGGSSSDVIMAAIVQAFDDGSQIITGSLGSSSGWASDSLAVLVSRVVAAGVPCTFAAGNEVGGTEGVWGVSSPACGDGVMAISSYNNVELPTYDNKTGVYSSPLDTGDGGFVSSWTSWGPTYELKNKPQFGTPGGNIMSTLPVSQGSYGVLSGTSMATPLAASIVALIAQVRGTFESGLIERALSSTARPNVYHGPDSDGNWGTWAQLAPAIQQGAGLVQAYDAAHATTLLSVSALSFNDSDHLQEQTFTVLNMGSSVVSYNLTHIPALTAMATQPIYRLSTPELHAVYADLIIDPSNLTLQPGGSATVRVTAVPPKGLDSEMLPFYSGWVALNGTDASGSVALSVPYIGLATSMKNATVMLTERMIFTRSNDYFSDSLPANLTFQLLAPAAHPDWAQPVLDDGGETILDAGDMPRMFVWLTLGTPLVRVEVLPLGCDEKNNTLTVSDNGLGATTLGNIAAFPATYVSQKGRFLDWNGQLRGGDWAPAGRYKLIVYTLRILGDRDDVADYDIFETPEMVIRYVQGS